MHDWETYLLVLVLEGLLNYPNSTLIGTVNELSYSSILLVCYAIMHKLEPDLLVLVLEGLLNYPNSTLIGTVVGK
jgi:uncharacterized protein YjeT (DUF2065 family)